MFSNDQPHLGDKRISRIDFFDSGFYFKGGIMYLYWRINNDLNCLGESILFHDPVFIRRYHQWIRQNAYALALAEGLIDMDSSNVCLN